jgi:hypothetical protein
MGHPPHYDTFTVYGSGFDASLWLLAQDTPGTGTGHITVVTKPGTVIKPASGKFTPSAPAVWGFCSAYRDGTGAGETLYQICMHTPTGNMVFGEWGDCMRGKLLTQWTPNPNPFQLVVYLVPDHAVDAATCAVGR